MDKQLYAAAGINSPLATEDQQAVERIALKLRELPGVQAVIADTAQKFKATVPYGPLSAAIFDYEYEQVYWAGLLAAANNDPSHPRIHAVNLFPHQTDGVDIVGTRALHPSPDYIYRLAPVDEARFAIQGRKPPHGPLAFEVSLLAAQGGTQGNLSLTNLAIAEDGSFTITISPEPADGRPNHLQSAPGAQHLIIRDIFGDLRRQRPMSLTIKRLDPPKHPPKTIAEIVRDDVPRHMAKTIDNTFALTGLVNKMPANFLPPPAFMNQTEALVTQAYAMGHYKLAQNQAFVITMTMGAAGYAVVPATNYWGGIGDFLQHRTCMSSVRAAPNEDGSFTYVVARSDPGVANWVETDGGDEGMLCVRWTAFRPGGPMPTLKAELVDWADLEAALPPGTPRADATGRREQIEQHRHYYTSWSRA